MKYLSDIELINRGDGYGVITKDLYVLPSLLDFMWVDYGHRYFIVSCSSLTKDQTYTR